MPVLSLRSLLCGVLRRSGRLGTSVGRSYASSFQAGAPGVYDCCAIGEARTDYCTAHSTAPSRALVEVEEETRTRLRQGFMMSGALNGQLLKMLVGLSGARRILELGTYTGYSALAMAEGLPEGVPGTEVVCIDPFTDEPESRKVFLGARERSPLGQKIRLVEDLGLPALDKLEEEGVVPFDFVFIDADKANYLNYFERLLRSPRKLLSPRALICVDNTLWYSRVLPENSAPDSTTREIREFNTRVAADPRVEVVMIPIRDGLTLIRLRP